MTPTFKPGQIVNEDLKAEIKKSVDRIQVLLGGVTKNLDHIAMLLADRAL